MLWVMMIYLFVKGNWEIKRHPKINRMLWLLCCVLIIIIENTLLMLAIDPLCLVVLSVLLLFNLSLFFSQEPEMPKGDGAQEHVSHLHPKLYHYHHPPGWGRAQRWSGATGSSKHYWVLILILLWRTQYL